MKNVLIAFTLLFAVLSFAQDKSNKKFQLGVSYALTNDDNRYSNPFGFYANYQIKKWEQIGLGVGLNTFNIGSNLEPNFTSKWAFNPNAAIAYGFFKNKLNTNFALGYYYNHSTFKPSQGFISNAPNRNITTTGFTVAPGVKYFVHPNIFFDANLTFVIATTKVELQNSEPNNNTYLNIGLGVAF